MQPICVDIMFHYLCARRIVSHKDDIGCVEVVTGSEGIGTPRTSLNQINIFGIPFLN